MVERKYRHLIEVGLTLLALSSMPLKFWDNAIGTAMHIIDQILPSSLLTTSPYECLFLKKPDYSSFRFFGCACYPFLRPYNRHKFQFHSSECAFLGYSTQHKGYMCLDTNGRVYILNDVLFCESRFPFQEHITKTTSTTSSPTYYPLIVLSQPT